MSLAQPLFRIAGFIAALAFAASAGTVFAQFDRGQQSPGDAKPVAGLPHVDFPSLDGKTTLINYLYRPDGNAPRPAVVMLHSCSGLFGSDGRFFPLYQSWLQQFQKMGYVVLVVDSATPRGSVETCSPGEAHAAMLRVRPKDAYAALGWLQAQPFVKPDKVALVGWSQGGGVVLLTTNDKSIGRPSWLQRDFAAAVSFYPFACSEQLQTQPVTDVKPQGWTTKVPLLVLMGEDDSWTELKPCAAFLAAAKARGNPVELKTYPHALHAFDAPGLSRTERPQWREPGGRMPVIGTDEKAREDVFVRVPAYLTQKLGK